MKLIRRRLPILLLGCNDNRMKIRNEDDEFLLREGYYLPHRSKIEIFR